MASLSQTTSTIRRGVIGFLVVAILIVAVDTLIKFNNSPVNPFVQIGDFYVPADSAFGSIPEPPIDSLAIAEDSEPTFIINGEFPETPNTALVYALNRPRTRFDTVDNAVATAVQLGFSSNYSEAGDVLTWERDGGTRSLSFNQLSKEWSYDTQYFLDPIGQRAKELEDTPQFYSRRLSSALGTLGITDSSINEATAVANFAKLGTDGLFTRPTDQRAADYVIIDLYRSLQSSAILPDSQLSEIQRQVEDPPEATESLVYTQDPRRGSLRAVATNDMQPLSDDLFSLEFTDFSYNYNYGVYEIVSPEEAWERIRNGDGYLVLSKLATDDYFAPNRILSVQNFVANAPETEFGYFEPAEWEGLVYPILSLIHI